LDSIERLVCFRRLEDLPLLVTVGMSKDEILAGYYQARWRYLGAAGAITLIMTLMTLWLVRHENKLVQATRALSESEHRSALKSDILEITLENMSQGIFLIEEDSHITVINQRARELLDLPDELADGDLTMQRIVDWQGRAASSARTARRSTLRCVHSCRASHSPTHPRSTYAHGRTEPFLKCAP
jgi:PAS domain-containing protein